MTKENNDLVLDQDNYIKNLDVPDISKIQNLKKADTLPPEYQSIFRSLASKLNMLALSARPDLAYNAKVLTMKYGSATKRDLYDAIRMTKMIKNQSSKLVIPDMGDSNDWIIVGVGDASNRTNGDVYAIAGYVILLVNKKTSAATVIDWSSKKIERVVTSSLAAETLSLQKMASNLYFVRKLLKELIGNHADSIPCLALIDNQDLFSCIHNIKSCEDKRLLADIINIRQHIHDDRTINEVRFIPREEMIADCLTKKTKDGEKVMDIFRTGSYEIPGGTTIRDSTRISVKTWQQLVTAERKEEN